MLPLHHPTAAPWHPARPLGSSPSHRLHTDPYLKPKQPTFHTRAFSIDIFSRSELGDPSQKLYQRGKVVILHTSTRCVQYFIYSHASRLSSLATWQHVGCEGKIQQLQIYSKDKNTDLECSRMLLALSRRRQMNGCEISKPSMSCASLLAWVGLQHTMTMQTTLTHIHTAICQV